MNKNSYWLLSILLALFSFGTIFSSTWTSVLNSQTKKAYAQSTPASELLAKAWESYRENKYNQTESFLSRMPSEYDEHPDINYLLGHISYKRNDFYRATRHLKKVLPHVTNPESRKGVTRLLERSKSFKNLNLRENQFSNFTIIRTPKIPRQTPTNVNHDLLKAYHQIGGDLNYFPDDRVTVILYLDSQFRQIVDAPVWSGGVFDGKIHLPYRSQNNEPYTKSTLFHEYSHALTYSLAQNNVPLWFNEGLATYQEHRQTRGYFDYRHLQNEPPENHINSFSDISRMFKTKQTRNGARLAYEYSYSIIHFLKQRYGMMTIMELLKRTGKTGSFDQSVETILNRSIHSLQRQWELWLRNEVL